jgi:hypothetical protein
MNWKIAYNKEKTMINWDREGVKFLAKLTINFLQEPLLNEFLAQKEMTEEEFKQARKDDWTLKYELEGFEYEADLLRRLDDYDFSLDADEEFLTILNKYMDLCKVEWWDNTHIVSVKENEDGSKEFLVTFDLDYDSAIDSWGNPNDPEDTTGYSLVGKITDDKALMSELTAFFSKLCNNTHTIKILDYKFDTSDGENNLKNYYYNDPGPEED